MPNKSKSRRSKRTRTKEARSTVIVASLLPPRLDAAQRALNIVEVASLICVHLRALVLGEEGSGGGESKHPFHLPANARILGKHLAPMARVNKAFCSSSVPHVWETLDTLTPLLETILGGERATTGPGDSRKQLVFTRGISMLQWRRFESYASKIKTLILKPGGPLVDSPWVSFLGSKIPLGMRWFPEVKRLVATCESPLASFLATSIIHQVKFLHILFTPSAHADVALLNSALPDPGESGYTTMTGLRVHHVASPQTLLCISKLISLRYVNMKISPTTTSQELIQCLGNLRELKRLTIKQDRCDDTSDNPLSTTQGYNAALSRPSSFNHLVSLSVDAETVMQCLIAAHISPRSLTSLDLLTDSHRDAALLPLVITVHTRRNPDLMSLNVKVKAEINLEGVDPLRADPVFHPQDFFTAISTPKGLQSLAIDGVPFFSRDIVDSMLSSVKSLEHLRTLKFLPVPPTVLPGDSLKLGSLTSLQKLAELNPSLRSLETLVEAGDAPVLPTEYLSKHRLERLSVRSNGKPPKSTQRRLDVAACLVRVFPKLKTISNSPGDEEGRKAWKKVEKIYFSHREVGAQALATEEVVKMVKESKSRSRSQL